MPTIAELAGVDVSVLTVEGSSLATLLLGDASPSDHDAVFGEMTRHIDEPFPMRAVRTETHRYIRNYNDVPVPLEGADQPWVEEVLASGAGEYGWGELHELLHAPRGGPSLLDPCFPTRTVPPACSATISARRGSCRRSQRPHELLHAALDLGLSPRALWRGDSLERHLRGQIAP